MASHMKTTVVISDALLQEAEKVIIREKTTLKALVNEGLSRVLKDRRAASPFKLRDASFKGGEGLTEEFEDASWEKVRDAIYENR
jgi:hypothetical protein